VLAILARAFPMKFCHRDLSCRQAKFKMKFP